MRFFGTRSNGEMFLLGREGALPKPVVGADGVVSRSFVPRRLVLRNWLKLRSGGIFASHTVSSRIGVVDGIKLELSDTHLHNLIRSWSSFTCMLMGFRPELMHVNE